MEFEVAWICSMLETGDIWQFSIILSKHPSKSVNRLVASSHVPDLFPSFVGVGMLDCKCE